MLGVIALRRFYRAKELAHLVGLCHASHVLEIHREPVSGLLVDVMASTGSVQNPPEAHSKCAEIREADAPWVVPPMVPYTVPCRKCRTATRGNAMRPMDTILQDVSAVLGARHRFIAVVIVVLPAKMSYAAAQISDSTADCHVRVG